jgi:ParB-like chromosome segregation protein Spo0J
VPALPQTYEAVPLAAVHPHPRNPRRGDLDVITESITTNGFFGACIAQRSTGAILVGNHRWQAAQQAGETTVPVLWVDVDDDLAQRIMVADNRTAELAIWDDPTLAEILAELRDADTAGLAGTGFTDADLDNLLATIGPPPTLEDLAATFGDPEPDALWPILRFPVPPEVMRRWKVLRERLDTDNDAAALAHLLDLAADPA